VRKRPKALIAWSSGKDSAWALHAVRQAGCFDIVGALTTITDTFGRVSMHGVREQVLDAQLAAARLTPMTVRIPYPCPNAIYERAMGEALAAAAADGVTHIVFGDLFLQDIRAYREERLRPTGIEPVFPLWQRPTDLLAREMIAGGLQARLVCVDPKALCADFAGRDFDSALLGDLPAGVDPCGENGEFHTCVTAGPMFAAALAVQPGGVRERDGFVFADLVLGTAI
jgi:diphthamide synthase (EF-2-diphthine--ammonia ligase)